MRNSLRSIALIGLIPVVGACASASAKTSADRPAMNVPPPPPRVIEATPEPPPDSVDLPSASAPSSASGASRSPRPATPKPAGSEARPEAKAGDPPVTEPVPVAAPPPATPPPQLSTPQTANASGAARNVQATVDRANGLLSGVDYGPLSHERKKAYDDAKRFIRQAEDALKRGNFVFAQGVATKAETLARELAGR